MPDRPKVGTAPEGVETAVVLVEVLPVVGVADTAEVVVLG
jgi:hypothetical protein